MGLVLDASPRALEEIIYLAPCVIIEPGSTNLKERQLLTEREYRKKHEQYEQEFQAVMGAEAVKQLLDNAGLDAETAGLKEELKSARRQRHTRTIHRLGILEAFHASGNQPG